MSICQSATKPREKHSIVSWKAQRLMGEDMLTNNPNTSAHPLLIQEGEDIV